MFKCPSGESREAENKLAEENQQQLLIGQWNLSKIFSVCLFLCIIVTQVRLKILIMFIIFSGVQGEVQKPKDIEFIIIEDFRRGNQ